MTPRRKLSEHRHQWELIEERKMDYHMTLMKYIVRRTYRCFKCGCKKEGWNMPKSIVKRFYGGWGHYGY